MGAPYTSVTVSGYNSNPPADDGSQTEANRVKWSTIKTKLPDPLKTAIETVNTNTLAAFGKVVGGGGVTTTAITYQVLAADQGKLVQATTGGITVTTPDATSVGAPFVFAFLNTSSGTVTFDGSGAQTVDGQASLTVPPGSGFLTFTDGSNWFTTGIVGVLAGKQLQYGDIINGTITESNLSNAVTFSLKTLAGTDPSATDPVLICFRSATPGTGSYVYRTVTAALTLVISSGSTLGATNGVAFRVWLVLFDDGGTIRLGAINCRSSTTIYPLGQMPVASSTAEGGAGAADSAQVFYTGTAVSSKAYVILGYASYESGLATAGTWNVSPTRLQLQGRADPLPGQILQIQSNSTGAFASGTTVLPEDDTIPTSTEGDQYMTQAITPVSAASVLNITMEGHFANNADTEVAMALFQDSVGAALAVGQQSMNTTLKVGRVSLNYDMVAATTSSTTFKMRAGGNNAGTTSFNGSSGARFYGGVLNSFMRVIELMT